MNAFLPGFEATDNFPVSNRKTSDDLSSTEASPDFRSDVAKGKVFNTHPSSLATGVDSINTLAAKAPISNRTLDSTEGARSTQPLSVRAIDFQVSAFVRTLSPQERAAVAHRPRFHTMPWLRPAGQDDTDQLP